MAPLEGPIGIGALVDALMFGGLVVQSCVYYRSSRTSAWFSNVVVSLVLFFLLLQLGCMVGWLWANGRTNPGDATVADYVAILFGVSNACGAVVLFVERFFFTHRILKLSNNHLLVLVFFISCIFSFMVALGAACIFFTEATVQLIHQLSGGWIFPLAIISGLVCDLAISMTTGFYLRFRTFEAAGILGCITRLFFVVAETGCVASLFGIAVVIVYWLTKSNFTWISLLVSMPGVSANCLLAAMNVHGQLLAEIEHQRASTLGDNLIDEHAKRPPIKITISKQVEKRSEESAV